MAFAGDDVQAEFDEAKRAEVRHYLETRPASSVKLQHNKILSSASLMLHHAMIIQSLFTLGMIMLRMHLI
eukprot:scaffold181750_cov17-Prasinocladus_malaysianus.AAC.1